MKSRTTQASRPLVPIFFATDDNYAPYLAVALRSLIDNSSAERDYRIHILSTGISEYHESILLGMQTDNVSIGFVDVSEKMNSICSRLHLRDYYTCATYYRFFIPAMFPEYDRGLYLDCDIVITRDVAELYTCQLGSNLVGAIVEEVMTDIEIFGRYSEVVLNIPRNRYFNAGILVMNLKAMRKMNILGAFSELLSQYTYRVAQDQDYLNVICRGRVKYIDKTWNKTPMPCNCDPANIPAIAHYKINYKPWRYSDVIYGEVFWKYAALTPVYESLSQMQANYTLQEKARDAAQYDALIQLAENEIDSVIATYHSHSSDDAFDSYIKDSDESGYVVSLDPLGDIVIYQGNTLAEVI
jgi:lipopolysaccharide biosynthesis glycosyltransferase